MDTKPKVGLLCGGAPHAAKLAAAIAAHPELAAEIESGRVMVIHKCHDDRDSLAALKAIDDAKSRQPIDPALAGGTRRSGKGFLKAAMAFALCEGLGRRPKARVTTTVAGTKKCRLPECQNKTNHNGGYCCAEHCSLHNPKKAR